MTEGWEMMSQRGEREREELHDENMVMKNNKKKQETWWWEGRKEEPRRAVTDEYCRGTEGWQRTEREREISEHLKATGEWQAEVGKWAVTQL